MYCHPLPPPDPLPIYHRVRRDPGLDARPVHLAVEAMGNEASTARFGMRRAANQERHVGVHARADVQRPFNARGIVERHDLRQQRSEEHTSELQSLMRISYAGLCLKKKKKSKSI